MIFSTKELKPRVDFLNYRKGYYFTRHCFVQYKKIKVSFFEKKKQQNLLLKNLLKALYEKNKSSLLRERSILLTFTLNIDKDAITEASLAALKLAMKLVCVVPDLTILLLLLNEAATRKCSVRKVFCFTT